MDFTIDSTKNKLQILFLLDKMEIPLTENSIIDICTNKDNNWLNVNYMECKDILWQLQQVGFVYTTKDDTDGTKYAITYEGRNCLAHFYNRLPQSMRENITQFAKDNRMTFKRSQEYLSEYYKNPDGSHTVKLKIKEPLVSAPLLEIKLKTPTRQSAIDACNRWKTSAPNVFEYLYDTIIDE